MDQKCGKCVRSQLSPGESTGIGLRRWAIVIRKANVYCSRSLRMAQRAVSIVPPGGTTKEGKTTDHLFCGVLYTLAHLSPITVL